MKKATPKSPHLTVTFVPDQSGKFGTIRQHFSAAIDKTLITEKGTSEAAAISEALSQWCMQNEKKHPSYTFTRKDYPPEILADMEHRKKLEDQKTEARNEANRRMKEMTHNTGVGWRLREGYRDSDKRRITVEGVYGGGCRVVQKARTFAADFDHQFKWELIEKAVKQAAQVRGDQQTKRAEEERIHKENKKLSREMEEAVQKIGEEFNCTDNNPLEIRSYQIYLTMPLKDADQARHVMQVLSDGGAFCKTVSEKSQ